LALHATTIFLAAFLLFQVQPLLARGILPWFGGAAGVWTTCVLFFQAALVVGHAYAHLCVRALGPRARGRLHAVLLAASVAVLPVLPSPAWKPSGPEDPTLRILGLLVVTTGVPYVLLASTNPLLQAWIAGEAVAAGRTPYRLHAVSNLGSLLGLIGYPLLVEPWLSGRVQAWAWSAAYVAFVMACALAVRRSARLPAARTPPARALGSDAPGVPRVLAWLSLAACASALMLAVTSHFTHDLAPVPFLWALPLSLYLLTFILCFDGEGWYRRGIALPVFAATGAGMVHASTMDVDDLGLGLQLALFGIGLFAGCMACHGELARLRPHPAHLTGYYLVISVGGVLGSLVVAVIAPLAFKTTAELPLAVLACGWILLARTWGARRSPGPWLAGLVVCAGATLHAARHSRQSLEGARLAVRNFYGTLRVEDEGAGAGERRSLTHGNVSHGAQYLAPERRRQTTTYYSPASGVGVALRDRMRDGPVHVGIVGLGAGTLAAYGRPGDRHRFYEINPLVVDVARDEFSFIRDSPAVTEIVLGDARLSLERESPQGFDVLAVDAFSSDAVPVHLLTVEAFRVYFRHLRADGILAVHVSNRFVDLTEVVAHGADATGKAAYVVDVGDDEDDTAIYSSTWVLVPAGSFPGEASRFETVAKPLPPRADLRPWTDDFSSILGVLHWRSGGPP
jgi:hypothetical protein